MKCLFPLLLPLLFSGCDSANTVSVGQDNQQDQPGPGVDNSEQVCTSERHPEVLDGLLVCTESIICNGVTIRGPELVSIPLRNCHDSQLVDGSFVPTPFPSAEIQGDSGGIQGSLNSQKDGGE